MHRTPWTTKSSLPSDRIQPPKPAPAPRQQQKAKNSNQPTQSSAVRQLQSLRDALAADPAGTHNDPTRACFCIARIHPLSPYTPICHSCGLILCALNPPHACCPHCASPLLAGSSRTALLSRLDAEINTTLANEEADKQRATEQARVAAGAFPSLSGGPSQAPPPRPVSIASPRPESHKVMSLGSKANPKSNKVTVYSYTPSPPPSRPASQKDKKAEDSDVPTRISAPNAEAPCASKPSDGRQTWAPLRGPSVTYIPPPPEAVDNGQSASHPASSRQRRRKGKGKERT